MFTTKKKGRILALVYNKEHPNKLAYACTPAAPRTRTSTTPQSFRWTNTRTQSTSPQHIRPHTHAHAHAQTRTNTLACALPPSSLLLLQYFHCEETLQDYMGYKRHSTYHKQPQNIKERTTYFHLLLHTTTTTHILKHTRTLICPSISFVCSPREQ